ncbi:MAG: hypothetical protein K2G40_00885 [Muribaculaceae bacterium]|nr:hypothetical protein [Muribaculaceae bacterium]
MKKISTSSRTIKTSARVALILFALMHLSLRVVGNETASSVLKHVYDRFNNQAVEISFKVNARGTSPQGIIVLDKDKFTIKTDELSTWYDGKTQWTLSKSINEVNVSNPSHEELAEINPLLILGSMSTKFNTELGDAPVGFYNLKLASKSTDYPISSATIKINSNDWNPSEITVVTNTGERYTFLINYVKNLSKIDKNCFRFNDDQFPGVDIIDLR